MFDLKIIGTGSFIPETVVTNQMMTEIVETSDEWITTRTGISERRLSSGEPTWYMGVQAAKKALEASGLDPLDIDMIVVTTITPDYYTPSTSCIIQDEIGAKKAFCFDMNAACTGFVYALDMAGRYLSTPGINNILIVASENISKIVDYSDRSTCVLFGDGSSAAIVSHAQPGDPSRLLSTVLGAEGDGGRFLVSAALELKHPLCSKTRSGRTGSITRQAVSSPWPVRKSTNSRSGRCQILSSRPLKKPTFRWMNCITSCLTRLIRASLKRRPGA